MKTIKITKAVTHKSNTWKPGDTPTVSIGLANDLIKRGIANDTKQAPKEQFKPTEDDGEPNGKK